MAYDKKSSKIYEQPFYRVYKAAYFAIKQMSGKILLNDPEHKQLQAQMDKKLYGKVLGDRSKLEIVFSTSDSGNETTISILAYPLNAVGQKLMFGARPGVVEAILAAFYAEVDKQLEKNT